MDLYFVGTQNKEHDEYMIRKNRSRLFSYAEKPTYTIKRYLNASNKLFIDSGAFSIANKVRRGKNLTIDDYIQFINENKRPDLFAAFDVIPIPLNTQTAKDSAEQSLYNYLYMLDRIEQKDKLIPVYHYGEDFSYLEKILSYDPKYIAFGGRGGVHTKYLYDCLDKFFDIISGQKVHAFGITVLDLLEQYPFTSADSTSYQKVATMGGIFLECLNKTVKVSVSTIKDNLHFNHLPDNIKKLILDEIEKYGYTLEQLQTNTNKRIEFNVDYFTRWEQNYEYKPRKKVRKSSLLSKI